MQASVYEGFVLCMSFLHQPAPPSPRAAPVPAALSHCPARSPPAIPSPLILRNPCKSILPGHAGKGWQVGRTKAWDPEQLQLPRLSRLGAWTPCFPCCFLLLPPWLMDQMSWSAQKTGRRGQLVFALIAKG